MFGPIQTNNIFFMYLTVFIVTTITGYILYARSKKELPNKILGFLFLATTFWVFCLFFSDTLKNPAQVLIWSKMAIIGPAWIPALLLCFSYIFPFRENAIPFKKLNLMLIFIPAIIIIFLSPTSYNVESVTVQSWGADFQPGYLYSFLLLYFVSYFTFLIIKLISKFKTASSLEKHQLKFLIIGFLVAAIFAVMTNVILPILGISNVSIFGPLAALILSIFIMYTVIKHQLMNLKLLVTEIVAYLIIIILLIQIFFSTNVFEISLRLLFLTVVLIAENESIKSMRREVKQREYLSKLTNQLEKANERLRDLDKLKDDFLSMAAHELNTPLAAIEGYLSMILEEHIGGDVSPTTKRYLDSVFLSSKRLSLIIHDMLNVSRIESGRIHLIYVNPTIESVIEQAISEIAPKAKEKKHNLIFNKPRAKIAGTWFDLTRTTEVLINILGNAIKFTEPGGKIEIAVKNDNSFITVWVKDNGRGIPNNKKDAVFQKFSQVDVLKDEIKGTGLGMYIAKKFIELQNGKIWFESIEGKGTTFFFTLPILDKKPNDPYEGEGEVLH